MARAIGRCGSARHSAQKSMSIPKEVQELFDVEEFTKANISLTIRDFPNMEYNWSGLSVRAGVVDHRRDDVEFSRRDSSLLG